MLAKRTRVYEDLKDQSIKMQYTYNKLDMINTRLENSDFSVCISIYVLFSLIIMIIINESVKKYDL